MRQHLERPGQRSHDVDAGNRRELAEQLHAELGFGGDVVMIGSARESEWSQHAPPPCSGAVYVVVKDDIDAHHDRAKAAGAEIVYGLRDQDYVSRDYSARDPEGNLRSFGTYAPE